MKYPLLEIKQQALENNVCEVVKRCKELGIHLAGVIKGANGLDVVSEAYIHGGAKWIASSRIEQLIHVKEKYHFPTMMIRIPMLSEVKNIITYCDYSLNSEIVTLAALNEEAFKQDKIHKVVIMADLGDLREGYIDLDELIDVALKVEYDFQNLYLAGIGVNLGCYGSIKPTVDNLGRLCEIATLIEDKIGRSLEIVSGGGTTTLPLVFNKTIPNKINHLRVGEGILLNADLPFYWKCDTKKFLVDDAFILKAEIIEIKEKPSYPIGEIFIDAFGNVPEYQDIGIRTKALLAVGKQDIGNFDKLIPMDQALTLIGASSDHLIADITDCDKKYKVGDIVEFKLFYQAMLFATESFNVKKEVIQKDK